VLLETVVSEAGVTASRTWTSVPVSSLGRATWLAIDIAALAAHCRQGLQFQAAREIRVVDSLPRTAAGKLQRRKLTDAAWIPDHVWPSVQRSWPAGRGASRSSRSPPQPAPAHASPCGRRVRARASRRAEVSCGAFAIWHASSRSARIQRGMRLIASDCARRRVSRSRCTAGCSDQVEGCRAPARTMRRRELDPFESSRTALRIASVTASGERSFP